MSLSAPNIYTNFSIWVRCAGVWGKLTPNEMGCSCSHSVRSLYVKEFTPVQQIFYTFFVLGLNVQVSGIKLPQWNGPFSQSFTWCQKHVCYSPRFYPRPPKNLHRYICHICDIMQLCSWFVQSPSVLLYFTTIWPFNNIMGHMKIVIQQRPCFDDIASKLAKPIVLIMCLIMLHHCTT